MRKVFLIFFIILLLPGCIGPEALVSPIVSLGIMWVNGEAHKYYPFDQKIIYKSTILALKELKIPISYEKQESTGFYIKAGDSDTFKITIKKSRENITKISIRVNTMGDKSYAELLYKTIDKNIYIIEFD